jgi:hypothetical protein
MIRGTMITEALTRLRFLFKRRRPGDLDDELRFHLDHAIAANLAAGISPEEARRRARIDFGGIEHAREETTRQHPAWLLSTLAQDARSLSAASAATRSSPSPS